MKAGFRSFHSCPKLWSQAVLHCLLQMKPPGGHPGALGRVLPRAPGASFRAACTGLPWLPGLSPWCSRPLWVSLTDFEEVLIFMGFNFLVCVRAICTDAIYWWIWRTPVYWKISFNWSLMRWISAHPEGLDWLGQCSVVAEPQALGQQGSNSGLASSRFCDCWAFIWLLCASVSLS